MADHVLEARVWLARPRPEVFAFFADPRNLAALTPPRFGLRLLSPVSTLSAGAVLDVRVRCFGVPLRSRIYIREYDPPYRFVDVQVRGPWARWEHRHQFLEDNHGTWVEDRVTYRLPLGPLGQLAHGALVHRQLRALWRYRGERLAAIFGARPG